MRLIYKPVAAYTACVHISLTRDLERHLAAESAYCRRTRPRVRKLLAVLYVHLRAPGHIKADMAVIHHKKQPRGKNENKHRNRDDRGVCRRAVFESF